MFTLQAQITVWRGFQHVPESFYTCDGSVFSIFFLLLLLPLVFSLVSVCVYRKLFARRYYVTRLREPVPRACSRIGLSSLFSIRSISNNNKIDRKRMRTFF